MITGIGGCSNSGKSALANELRKHFGYDKSVVLCQDDFVKYSGELPKIDGHTDWEQPSSIKIDEFINAVKENSSVFEYVFVEGLFAFWFDRLNALYDKKLFLELDKATFIKRKKNDYRWGKEPDWYIEHIWNSYLKYGRPPEDMTGVFKMTATLPVDIQTITKHIKSR